GLEYLACVRGSDNRVHAIYINSLSCIDDLKKGFALGADDYLKKPFDLEELQTRIEHIAKVYNLADEITFDSIRFNPKLHKIYDGQREINMRQKESAVLEYFIRNQSKVISCDELIENLWSDDQIPTHATIRTYIKNLRRLFDRDYIENIKGEGYRFNIL
ncbi:MAG TPA: response regulator transcription factor, partial [Epsilonproteobacteria bacterium]|nr:response regulator transcription factor [Campylobacterota bacterium]